jgi:uncharacterized membrane protein YbhN (UPF0104 family)
VDVRRLADALRQADGAGLALSLAMVVPLTLLSARRLQYLVPAQAGLGLGGACRLILLGSMLNMVLPSKMGDVAKAYFLARDHRMAPAVSLALVVFEKACDLLALLAWCALGLALTARRDAWAWGAAAGLAGLVGAGAAGLASSRAAAWAFRAGSAVLPRGIGARLERLAAAWHDLLALLWRTPGRVVTVAGVSLAVWLLHLVQIWLFALALGGAVPFLANLALAGLALVAGLAPLTLAGIGTRDAALLVLYAPFLPPAAAAALGLLCTVRYLVPALAGAALVGDWRAWQAGARSGR